MIYFVAIPIVLKVIELSTDWDGMVCVAGCL